MAGLLIDQIARQRWHFAQSYLHFDQLSGYSLRLRARNMG
jgi:hypothetical protein